VRKFGLIGYPLEHSFSPEYFREKFIREKISDSSYELFPIATINELHSILENNPWVIGLNVTIPYKKVVLRHLNSSVGIPQGIHACNCIKVVDGKLIGYNTDVIGFEKSLVPLLKQHHTRALVLGNGGSAEAVVYVLKKLNIDYTLVSRELHNGSLLTYNDVTEEVIKLHSIIINTTPVGMHPMVNNCVELPYKAINKQHLCYDLIYNPTETLFLANCKAQGAIIKNGHEMLTIQAEESWKIWNP